MKQSPLPPFACISFSHASLSSVSVNPSACRNSKHARTNTKAEGRGEGGEMRGKEKPFEWKIHKRSPDRWDGKAWPENLFRVVHISCSGETWRERAKGECIFPSCRCFRWCVRSNSRLRMRLTITLTNGVFRLPSCRRRGAPKHSHRFAGEHRLAGEHN